MKQDLQARKCGHLSLADVSHNFPKWGHPVAYAATSLVSADNEKYMLELAHKSVLGKTLAQLDLVHRPIASPKLVVTRRGGN